MSTGRHRAGPGGAHAAPPWWRPAAYSAAATAAIAALFNPIPAFAAPPVPAAPSIPQVPAIPAVPDVGSRPIPLGTLTMPGQSPVGTPSPAPGFTGVALTPVLQKIEKGRAEIATLGDQLIVLGQDRDLARDQHAAAQLKYTQANAVLQEAQAKAAEAAAQSMREAAALPPGSYQTGLSGLEDLARLQRGNGNSQEAVARTLVAAQSAVQVALAEEIAARQRYDDLVDKYNKANLQLSRKQAAQQALELRHADELTAAETSETAADSRLGAQYLAGAEAGRGADPRALQALQYALAQRGDPYVWSEEGPDQYDCSGLMYMAYRKVGFPLQRVSRDQYLQTINKVVDRYSLLPGDLLFFSYSNSWRGIHHVAMYAGNGMMVEAPRTGLNVRLVPVRWSRLFQATRVFGSVEGVTEGPDLGSPDPEPTPGPSTKPPTTPPTTPPTSKPTTPPTSPSKPTTPPTSPSTPPTSPSTPTTPSTPPTSSPPTSSPTPDPDPTASEPEPTTAVPTSPPPPTAAPTTVTPSGSVSGTASASSTTSKSASASASTSKSSTASTSKPATASSSKSATTSTSKSATASQSRSASSSASASSSSSAD